MWSDLAVKRMVSDLDEYEEEEEEEEEEDGRADNSGNGSSLSLRINRAPVTEAVAPRERDEDKGKASRKEEEEIVNERTSGSSNDTALDSTTASLKVNSHAASNEATGEPMDISSSSSLHLIPAPAPVTVPVPVPVPDHLTPTAEIKADVTNLTANHTHSTTGVVSGESASTEACTVEREVGGWTICLPNDPDYASSGTQTGQNLSGHSDSAALLQPLPPLYTGGTSVGTKRFASMMLKSSQQRPKIGRLHTTGCVALFGPEY